MRLAGRILVGLLPLVLLLAASEAVLWALGLGTPVGRLSMSRGFDRSAAYVVPDPEVPGGWRTQMFEVEELEVHVPPKGGLRRLIMVGGSNTQGFPQQTLGTLLSLDDPDPGWEVVNLGRSGYGSERVSILLEQAVEHLQPDVVLIYSGHNEFMERGFAEELLEQGALAVTGRVADAFMRLRTMNVLVGALQPELKDRSFDRKPEPRIVGRDEAYRTLQYEQTLAFWEAYRDNLEAMCRDTTAHGVPVVLCTIIGNDFVSPYVTNHSAEWSEERVTTYRKLRLAAARLIPERYRRHLVPAVHLDQPDWGVTLRPEERAARDADPPADGRAIPPQRALLGPLAMTPQTGMAKAVSVEGAHWADPRLWTTAVYDLLETMSALHARSPTEDERAALASARELYAQALEAVPDHPQGLFEAGLVAYALGEADEARELLQRSIDLDRAPRRGNRVSNAMVREVAARVPGVVLADAEEQFRGACPDRLIGYEVMTDVCHLQPGARPILMSMFVGPVLEAWRAGVP